MTNQLGLGTGVQFTPQKTNIGMELAETLKETIGTMAQFKNIIDTQNEKEDKDNAKLDDAKIDKFTTSKMSFMNSLEHSAKFAGLQEKDLEQAINNNIYDIRTGKLNKDFVEYTKKNDTAFASMFKDEISQMDAGKDGVISFKDTEKGFIKLLAKTQKVISDKGTANLSPEQIAAKKKTEQIKADSDIKTGFDISINKIELKLGEKKEDGSGIYSQDDIDKEISNYFKTVDLSRIQTPEGQEAILATKSAYVSKQNERKLKNNAIEVANATDAVKLQASKSGLNMTYNMFEKLIQDKVNYISLTESTKMSEYDIQSEYSKHIIGNVQSLFEIGVKDNDVAAVKSAFNQAMSNIAPMKNKSIENDLRGKLETALGTIYNATHTAGETGINKMGTSAAVVQSIFTGESIKKAEDLQRTFLDPTNKGIAYNNFKAYNQNYYGMGYKSENKIHAEIMDVEKFMVLNNGDKSYSTDTQAGFDKVVALINKNRGTVKDKTFEDKAFKAKYKALRPNADANEISRAKEKYDFARQYINDNDKAISYAVKRSAMKKIVLENNTFVNVNVDSNIPDSNLNRIVRNFGERLKSQVTYISDFSQDEDFLLMKTKDGRTHVIKKDDFKTANKMVATNSTGEQDLIPGSIYGGKSGEAGFLGKVGSKIFNRNTKNGLVMNSSFYNSELEGLTKAISTKKLFGNEGLYSTIDTKSLPKDVAKIFKEGSSIYARPYGKDKIIIDGKTLDSNGNRTSIVLPYNSKNFIDFNNRKK